MNTIHFAWYGFMLLNLAIFPLAAAGKTFVARPISALSRHAMLAGLPLTILLFAGLRATLLRKSWPATGRFIPPVICSLVIVSGAELFTIYFDERTDWILNRTVLHHAERDKTVRESSVILTQGKSFNSETIYGT